MLGRRELYHQQEGSLSGRCQVGFNALFALPIAARAVASLALWNIAACTALIVVVINALFVRFLGLFSGEILGDFCHWTYASIHRTKFGLSPLHGGGKNFCDGFHRGTHLPLPAYRSRREDRYWRAPRILGPTPKEPKGPAVIWAFFKRQQPR